MIETNKSQGNRKYFQTSLSLKRLIVFLVSIVFIVIVVYFFKGEFEKNWNIIQNTTIRYNYLYLAISFLCIVISSLVNTKAWCSGANIYARGRKITFAESIGMVNTTQLTKYIPGKVWGYAMQMVLVDRSSISRSVVLFVNVFITLTSIFITLIVGGIYFTSASMLVPKLVAMLFTAILVAAYVFFLTCNNRFFSALQKMLAFVIKKPISVQTIKFSSVVRLQSYYVVSSILFGISALFCYAGLGFSITFQIAFCVVAGFLFSDTIGFLVFLVPGGIGIREGILYFILKEYGIESIALILPIALRLVSMVAEGFLGLLGIAFLRSYVSKIKHSS